MFVSLGGAVRRAAPQVARRVGLRRPGDEGFGWMNVVGWVVFVGVVVAAYFARRQAPWIPLVYLSGLVVAGIAVWRFSRWHGGRSLVRWPGLAAASMTMLALVPVPWMKASVGTPPGTAWRLDGRVEIDGEIADPPGSWYWLTAGRPPLVAELVTGWIVPGTPPPTDLRGGRTTSQPQVSEPAAALVGVRLAGVDVDHVDAEVGGWLARTPPGQWFRKLATGRSHGMMVALVAYAHTSDQDLARGRSIAGTGGIERSGRVSPIGGLVSKATAARDTGADVLLYPAIQSYELRDFDAGSMQLVGIETLDDAIEALSTVPTTSTP